MLAIMPATEMDTHMALLTNEQAVDPFATIEPWVGGALPRPPTPGTPTDGAASWASWILVNSPEVCFTAKGGLSLAAHPI